jgi:hypothetical protein
MRGVDDKVRKGALSFWCEGDEADGVVDVGPEGKRPTTREGGDIRRQLLRPRSMPEGQKSST